jgi:YidC/Oxa1 family membrane protein insertase
MNIMPTFLCSFWLQSNETIRRLVEGTAEAAPHFSDYHGLTGTFAAFFLQLIHALGAFVGNYGLAVILSAVLIRMMLIPLTRGQIRGMKAMQVLQPVMKAIQREYPDKQDQSAKTMELYSKYKINPLAGCLPLLIQLPILFGVYQALYDPSFAGKNFFGLQLLFPVNLSAARNLGQGADLQDVIDVTVVTLGLQHQLWEVPAGVPLLGGQVWYLPALLLVALYIVSSLGMQRYMKKVNAPDKTFEEAFFAEMKIKAGDLPPDPGQDFANQMQKQMGLMNVMIILFAFIFSTGALLYYIVQNCVMILEYTILPRGMQLALEPRELKAFIRQAPVPLGQPVKRDDPRPERKAELKPSEEDGDEGADGTAVLKPRPRKRRKR